MRLITVTEGLYVPTSGAVKFLLATALLLRSGELPESAKKANTQETAPKKPVILQLGKSRYHSNLA